MHPLLSLNSHAMQSSLLECLKSLSRSLMIHATVLSRPWPCSWEMFNLWTKHMTSIPSSSNQSSKLFEATRSGRGTKFQKETFIVFGLYLLWYFCLHHRSMHLSNWMGRIQYMVEIMLNSFKGYRQPTSLSRGFVILRQVRYTCSKTTSGPKLFKTIACEASFSAGGEVLQRSSVGNSCICTPRYFL